MRLAMAAFVASTGCAQIFGLDTTSAPDANTDLATVTVQRISVGATVNKGPQDLAGQTAKFIQADGTEVDGTFDLMGKFTSETPGTPAAMVSVPQMSDPLRLIALNQRVQSLPLLVFEHPSPMPPATTSNIKLTIALPSMYTTGESFQVRSVGAWMSYALVAADLPAVDTSTMINTPTDIPYTSFKPIVTGNADTRIISTDVTLLLRYKATALTGVFQAQFDQTDGTDTMQGTMTAVTADKSFTTTIDTAALTSRFTAVRPMTAAPTFSWRIDAAPGYSVASTTGVQLDTATFTAGPVTSPYANPFESLDWHAILTMSASSSRTYMYTEGANMVSVGLSTSTSVVGEPASVTDAPMDAGLASTIQLDQTLLSTDGAAIKLDLTKPVPFSVIVDRPINTAFEFFLVEIGIDATGATPKLTRKVDLHGWTLAAGTMASFSIPPELFMTGKSYYVTVRAVKGLYNGASTGDLTQLSLPYTTSTVDSAVFQVMP